MLKRWGVPVGLSIIWVCVVIYYCISKCINPFELEPNNFGDFLAGSVAPLAIFWLIFGYLLQAKELAAQVEQTKQLVQTAKDDIKLAESLEVAKMLPRFSYNRSKNLMLTVRVEKI